MHKRGDYEFLRDIREAVKRTESYAGRMNYEAFLKDIKTQDAVVRNLEIIGEAVKNISANLKDNHNEIDWKNISGMRDKIIHFYFGVDWDIVWKVIQDKLPDLKRKIDAIIRGMEK